MQKYIAKIAVCLGVVFLFSLDYVNNLIESLFVSKALNEKRNINHQIFDD